MSRKSTTYRIAVSVLKTVSIIGAVFVILKVIGNG